MAKLPHISSISSVYYGQDPHLDAWLLHFMLENNIEHLVNPRVNASSEQLRFMVDIDEGQLFAPCTDWMFSNLLQTRMSPELLKEYLQTWKRQVLLIRDFSGDRFVRKKVLSLCRHIFSKVLKSPFMIPSRLHKRMLDIFLSQNMLQDPYKDIKQEYNRRAHDFMQTPGFFRFISSCPATTMQCERIQDLRWQLDLLELKRFFCLSTWKSLWQEKDFQPSSQDLDRELGRPWKGFEEVMTSLFGPGGKERLKILYLPSGSGGIIFDLQAVNTLIRQGHRVILALKEGFYYDHPTYWDCESDDILSQALNDASFLADSQASKNELLKSQRENSLVVISDGSRERMNLYRTSVTFARAWKESDLIIAKGQGNYRRIIENSHRFTRDILCLYRDSSDQVRFHFKEKSPRVRKITEKEIVGKAEEIKKQMLSARMKGQRVLFYSAIIGSIPGQTQTAIKLLNTFVEYMRSRMSESLIINPAEHFEPGMDGDDLMYMWEIVQRSGLIDVWRFQSVRDIEKSFELLGERVPPVWAGKDSTFSTGCTKEMHIALDVQKKYPEMQIIGPSPEQFFRRREYGVGKFFDVNIEKEPGHYARS